MREEKRKLVINDENYSDAPIRIGEKVDSFQWECVYVDENHSIRKVRWHDTHVT